MITSSEVLSLLLSALCIVVAASNGNSNTSHHWLINNPPPVIMGDGAGSDMANYGMTHEHQAVFAKFVEDIMPAIDSSVDGEAVDAFEHFFWGQFNGVVLDLGAMDGTPHTKSQSFALDSDLNWSRLLIEGDSRYRETLLKKSRSAYSVNAVICPHHTNVHFANVPNIGGILEFMDLRFLKEFHLDIYNAGTPPGNLALLDWASFPQVQAVECMPVSTVLHKSRTQHINLFLLDVKGAELEVLHTINFAHYTFDVLCVETDPPFRPKDYAKQVSAFLEKRGYINYTGQIGRNIWYVRKGYIPFVRPGLDKKCFNGYRKSQHANKLLQNKDLPAFVSCPLKKK